MNPSDSSRDEMATEALSPAEGAPPPPPPDAPGCAASLQTWLAAFGLTPFSPTFYRHAARQRVIGAIGFLALLAAIISLLQTVSLLRGTRDVLRELRDGLAETDFPTVTVSGGRTTIDGPDPYVVFDEEGTLVVVDTTGTYTADDVFGYQQAAILTGDTIIFYQDGELQQAPLSEMNAALGDPIVISEQTITRVTSSFLLAFAGVGLVVIFLWHTVGTLAYVALLGLAVWGVTTLIRSGTSFAPVLVTGLYATLPALLARFMMRQISANFPGLFTLVLLAVWIGGLAVVLMSREPEPGEGKFGRFVRAERPLRAWRALIAAPFLLVVALEMVFQWKAWYVTWPLGVTTLLALLVISLWPLVGGEEKSPGV